MKMKLAAGASQPEQTTKVAEEKKEAERSNTKDKSEDSSKSKQDDTVTDLPGMIGSVTEYAKILGKSVNELNDEKYDPPPQEQSDSEEEGGSDQEGDLWGAIMGAP